MPGRWPSLSIGLGVVKRYIARMQIGPYSIAGQVFLAPMAGVTDRPFRLLARELGAALAASEMVASNPALRQTRQSQLKRNHNGEPAPRVVQIAGALPDELADAARFNVAEGAQIIDINMGCPAKKVCQRMAGSALLADPPLVERILKSVVEAVDVPVTLKIRTGPTMHSRNAVDIAQIAEQAGIKALALHGRTRDQHYKGEAEHETLAAVRKVTALPLIGNGDIATPWQAQTLMERSGCDAVMIGRGAQGRPWIFQEIQHFLNTGQLLDPPSLEAIRQWMLSHLRALHVFYGSDQGVRVARKHIGWYLKGLPGGEGWRRELVGISDACEQLRMAAAAITDSYTPELAH